MPSKKMQVGKNWMGRSILRSSEPIEKKTENYFELGLDRGLPTVKGGRRTTTTEIEEKQRQEQDKHISRLKKRLGL